MIFPDTALKLLMEASVGHHDRLLACGVLEGRIESLEETLEGKSNQLVAAYEGWDEASAARHRLLLEVKALDARVTELEAALRDAPLTLTEDDLRWAAHKAERAALAAEGGEP